MSSESKLASTETVIEISGASKSFRSYKKPSDRLRQIFLPNRSADSDVFHALKNVSLSVSRGETVGIVGRNGSGKSTLLQLICGTVRQTAGEIQVNGRIAALLELGAGFNPEFTGRENVHLNAAILGMSQREITDRFESIERFAEIGEFIDRPVKTYSSGMYIRLAFATAINADPELLIIDEALAVGDEAFQRKCFARLEEIQEAGGTILFVSHSAGSVLSLCNRAILLDEGEKLADGQPKFVVNQYQRLLNASPDNRNQIREDIRNTSADTMVEERDELDEGVEVDDPRGECKKGLEHYDPNLISKSRVEYESRGAKITDIRLENTTGEQVNTLEIGQDYIYRYRVLFFDDFENVSFGMMVKTTDGINVSGATTSLRPDLFLPTASNGQSIEVTFKFRCELMPATYFANAGVLTIMDGEEVYLHRILEGMMFKVAFEKNLVATGIFNLQTEDPEIQLI